MVDEPAAPDEQSTATELMDLVEELYPLCRSITGDGVRATLETIGRIVPLAVHEVASGTPVLDWTVPPEWNIDDAYIADTAGRRIVDFRTCNLHVVSYSVPVARRMSLDELRPHLHTLPNQPDLIPYRTSYYEETWGFCLSQRQLDAMEPGEYEVRIDSRLEPGHLTYGEFVVPGRTPAEFLVSTHVCHPSLCDDNLSGIAVSALLARQLLAGAPPRHTFRFLFAPGTIGAITWLAHNPAAVSRVKHGLTLTCLGDAHHFTYKRTVDGGHVIDRAAAVVLAATGREHELIDFFPYGYDERQYNSPGFRLPVGSLMRGRHGQFPEYHTSADNRASCPAPAWWSPSRCWQPSSRRSTAIGWCGASPHTASPSSVAAVCTAPSAAPTSPISNWQCCGFSASPTGGTPCSMSPRDPASVSPLSRPPPSYSSSMTSSKRCPPGGDAGLGACVRHRRSKTWLEGGPVRNRSGPSTSALAYTARAPSIASTV
jgi:aminopeptidase-like protein